MLTTNLQNALPCSFAIEVCQFPVKTLWKHSSSKCKSIVRCTQVTLSCFVQEVEAALEAEESKVTRAQLELTQYKQEAEKRIADKDEELENIRYVRAVKCLS